MKFILNFIYDKLVILFCIQAYIHLSFACAAYTNGYACTGDVSTRVSVCCRILECTHTQTHTQSPKHVHTYAPRRVRTIMERGRGKYAMGGATHRSVSCGDATCHDVECAAMRCVNSCTYHRIIIGLHMLFHIKKFSMFIKYKYMYVYYHFPTTPQLYSTGVMMHGPLCSMHHRLLIFSQFVGGTYPLIEVGRGVMLY